MFERFTDRARRVLVLAQEESRLLGHGFIGSEHILLGLIHEHDGMAARALADLGVDLEDIRRRVADKVPGPLGDPGESPAFTPQAKRILEFSLREALQLGDSYIGTEHLLLGIVRDDEAVATQVLAEAGASVAQVRQKVMQVLSPAPGGQTPAVARATGPLAGSGGEEHPLCTRCRSPLASTARYLVLQVPPDPAGQSDGDLPVTVVFCRACGSAFSMTAAPPMGRHTRARRGADVADAPGIELADLTPAEDPAAPAATAVRLTVRGRLPDRVAVTGTIGDRAVAVQVAGHRDRGGATGTIGDMELLATWESGGGDDATDPDVPARLQATLGGQHLALEGAFRLGPGPSLAAGRVTGEVKGQQLSATVEPAPGAHNGSVHVEGTVGPTAVALTGSVAADRSGAAVQGAVGDQPVELLVSVTHQRPERVVQVVGDAGGPLGLLLVTVGAILRFL